MSSAGKTSSISLLEREEFLLGILLINVTSFFLRDFLVLLFYKTLKMTGQSTLSSFILFFMAFAGLFIYFRLAPKKTIEELEGGEEEEG